MSDPFDSSPDMLAHTVHVAFAPQKIGLVLPKETRGQHAAHLLAEFGMDSRVELPSDFAHLADTHWHFILPDTAHTRDVLRALGLPADATGAVREETLNMLSETLAHLLDGPTPLRFAWEEAVHTDLAVWVREARAVMLRVAHAMSLLHLDASKQCNEQHEKAVVYHMAAMDSLLDVFAEGTDAEDEETDAEDAGIAPAVVEDALAELKEEVRRFMAAFSGRLAHVVVNQARLVNVLNALLPNTAQITLDTPIADAETVAPLAETAQERELHAFMEEMRERLDALANTDRVIIRGVNPMLPEPLPLD